MIDEPELLRAALARLQQGFTGLPEFVSGSDEQRIATILQETAQRLHDNYPYQHPLYCGQMLKPPHPLARLAYALAMHINPNNHALDGGRASSALEKEAVAELAAMFGWQTHLGHLTGGGTMANLEALWVASRERGVSQTVLASTQAHYTHQRISAVLQLPYESIAVDRAGRMDVAALEARLQQGGVATVVATLGTTALGAVDSLPDILALRERYGFRLHVDAAYGGYYRLANNLDTSARAAFEQISQADSIVIDPHKHGLQPYGCGCVLFRDPAVGRFYQHDSPYTYFSSDELHLGEISLECSRPGAAATALWATQRLLPLQRDGEFATGLAACRQAALELHDRLQQASGFHALLPPELDIVVWSVAGDSASDCSARNQALFGAAACQDLHLALTRLPRSLLADWLPAEFVWDAEELVCLRACLMKPEHRDWLPEIWVRLEAALGQ